MPDPFLDHPLRRHDLVVTIALFTVFILYIYGSISQRWSNFVLCSQKLLLQLVLARSGQNPKDGARILADIPTDIRTVSKLFHLTPTIVVYTTCPACSATYTPYCTRDGFDAWPLTCTYRKFGETGLNDNRNPPCGYNLTSATQTINGQSTQYPSRAFPAHRFQDFIAGLVCRPGMEKVLQEHPPSVLTEHITLTDVFHGTYLQRDLKDPLGNVFIDALDGKLQLVWLILVDFFNPLHNKAAGKSVSVGSIALTCLNLPPHLRYKPRNQFVFGLIPLPHKPKKEEINHFICPVMNVMVLAWKDGTFLLRTPEQSMGLIVRSALAMLIVNMQGRKTSGFAHSNSCLHPCPYCHILQANINEINLSSSKFKPKTDQEARDAGQKWHEATSQALWDALHAALGSRYTEFLRLRY
jgi:hypothetical protein